MTAQMQLHYCNTSDEVRWQLLLDWPESDTGFLSGTGTRWCGNDDKVTKYNQFCTGISVGSILDAERDTRAMVMSRRKYIYYLLYSTFSTLIVSFLFIEEAEQSPQFPRHWLWESVLPVYTYSHHGGSFLGLHMYMYLSYVYIYLCIHIYIYYVWYTIGFLVERKRFILTSF